MRDKIPIEECISIEDLNDAARDDVDDLIKQITALTAENERLKAEIEALKEDANKFPTMAEFSNLQDDFDRLTADKRELVEGIKKANETLEGIANADWKKWDDPFRDKDSYISWAKSRCSWQGKKLDALIAKHKEGV